MESTLDSALENALEKNSAVPVDPISPPTHAISTLMPRRRTSGKGKRGKGKQMNASRRPPQRPMTVPKQSFQPLTPHRTRKSGKGKQTAKIERRKRGKGKVH